MKKRKVLSVEQIIEKFNKANQRIAEATQIAHEKIEKLKDTVLSHKVLFGHVPPEVSDELVLTHLELWREEDSIGNSLVNINVYDENGNVQEECRKELSGAAWGSLREFRSLCAEFDRTLRENNTILFPAVRNGFLVKCRANKLRRSSWVINGDLEQDCLAHELGVVYEKPTLLELPPQWGSENCQFKNNFKDYHDNERAIRKQNWQLRQESIQQYKQKICNKLTYIPPRQTKDFHIYEWKLKEGKVMQFFSSRKKGVKNQLKIKGNAKNEWLEGRMFYMSGIMFYWKKNRQGKIVPSFILGGNSSHSMCLVDLLTNTTLKPA
jgi:hypothetical protein